MLIAPAPAGHAEQRVQLMPFARDVGRCLLSDFADGLMVCISIPLACLLEQRVDEKTQPMLYAMKRYVNRSMRITLTVRIFLAPSLLHFTCPPKPTILAAHRDSCGGMCSQNTVASN